MATMPNPSSTAGGVAAARQSLVLEAPTSQHNNNSMHQQQQHQRHPYYASNNNSNNNSHNNGGGGTSTSSSSNSGSAGSSPLEIAYSTISPKVDATPPYPMHIKLSLIDQNAGYNGCVSCWICVNKHLLAHVAQLVCLLIGLFANMTCLLACGPTLGTRRRARARSR